MNRLRSNFERNDLMEKKITIKNSYGNSLYSLLKGGDDAIEKYKIKSIIKNLLKTGLV